MAENELELILKLGDELSPKLREVMNTLKAAGQSREVKQTESGFEKIGKSAQKAGAEIKGIFSPALARFGIVTAAVSGAVYAGIKAMDDMSERAARTLKLEKLSEKTRVAVADIKRMEISAESFGATGGEVAEGLKRWNDIMTSIRGGLGGTTVQEAQELQRALFSDPSGAGRDMWAKLLEFTEKNPGDRLGALRKMAGEINKIAPELRGRVKDMFGMPSEFLSPGFFRRMDLLHQHQDQNKEAAVAYADAVARVNDEWRNAGDAVQKYVMPQFTKLLNVTADWLHMSEDVGGTIKKISLAVGEWFDFNVPPWLRDMLKTIRDFNKELDDGKHKVIELQQLDPRNLVDWLLYGPGGQHPLIPGVMKPKTSEDSQPLTVPGEPPEQQAAPPPVAPPPVLPRKPRPFVVVPDAVVQPEMTIPIPRAPDPAKLPAIKFDPARGGFTPREAPPTPVDVPAPRQPPPPDVPARGGFTPSPPAPLSLLLPDLRPTFVPRSDIVLREQSQPDKAGLPLPPDYAIGGLDPRMRDQLTSRTQEAAPFAITQGFRETTVRERALGLPAVPYARGDRATPQAAEHIGRNPQYGLSTREGGAVDKLSEVLRAERLSREITAPKFQLAPGAKVEGDASISVDFNNVPRGVRTGLRARGMFKRTLMTRSTQMNLAPIDGDDNFDEE